MFERLQLRLVKEVSLISTSEVEMHNASADACGTRVMGKNIGQLWNALCSSASVKNVEIPLRFKFKVFGCCVSLEASLAFATHLVLVKSQRTVPDQSLPSAGRVTGRIQTCSRYFEDL